MRRDHDLPVPSEETLATAASPEEVARVLYRALRLMESHALESDLDELAFLLGVAALSAREAMVPTERSSSADNMH